MFRVSPLFRVAHWVSVKTQETMVIVTVAMEIKYYCTKYLAKSRLM